MLKLASMERVTIILSTFLFIAVLSAGCTQTEEILPLTPTNGSSLAQNGETPMASPPSKETNPENKGFSFTVVEYPTDAPDGTSNAIAPENESRSVIEIAEVQNQRSVTITPTATPVKSAVSTEEPTPSPVPTEEPTKTVAPTKVPTATPKPTKVPTATPIPTKVPTATPKPTKVPTATPKPTKVPTATPIPTKVPTATPIPTVAPTNTPEPTSTPSIATGSGSFSMSTANTQRPSGVLQTVSFFMGGGGGVCYGETTPEVTYGAPSYELLPYSQETYISDEVTFGTCGWNDSSPLAAYLFFEDTQLTFGDTIEVSQVPTGEFMAVHFVDLPENPQAGNYSVLLGDADEALTIEFSLVWPTEPRMYRLADGSVMLWNFQPNERVTLFAYDELQNQPEREGQFVGYQTYQTDSDGWLYVEVNQLVDAFGVVGEDTGQISESFTHFMIASPIME